jgi:hypothetical protein
MMVVALPMVFVVGPSVKEFAFFQEILALKSLYCYMYVSTTFIVVYVKF